MSFQEDTIHLRRRLRLAYAGAAAGGITGSAMYWPSAFWDQPPFWLIPAGVLLSLMGWGLWMGALQYWNRMITVELAMSATGLPLLRLPTYRERMRYVWSMTARQKSAKQMLERWLGPETKVPGALPHAHLQWWLGLLVLPLVIPVYVLDFASWHYHAYLASFMAINLGVALPLLLAVSSWQHLKAWENAS